MSQKNDFGPMYGRTVYHASAASHKMLVDSKSGGDANSGSFAFLIYGHSVLI